MTESSGDGEKEGGGGGGGGGVGMYTDVSLKSLWISVEMGEVPMVEKK